MNVEVSEDSGIELRTNIYFPVYPVRQLPIKSCAKNTRHFFIVFLCELCVFARDFFGSGLSGLGIKRVKRLGEQNG